MENELMLSILSGLAESESVSIAENSKWSVKRRFQNGTFKISYPPYGYDNVDGKMIVNENQAEIVRFIFAEVLSGKGTHKIADDLNHRKVPTKKGGRWTATTIRGMVSNEKYTGDAIFQKTYTDEYFNRHNNYGEKDQYLIKNHHEAIISHEVFETTQIVIVQRGKEKGVEKRNQKYQNRYPFSGKIICGQCGGTFKRRSHSSGKKYIAWCCSTHIADIKKCSMKYIPESDFEFAFITMMNKLIFGHKTVLRPLLVSLRGMNSSDSLVSIQELDKKLEENAEQRKVLVGLMTKGYLEPAAYNKGNNELLQETERLQRLKESLVNFLNSDTQSLNEVSELLRYVTKAMMLTCFDGEVFESFVERIVVFSRSEIGFELKCGLTLKERLVK
jgi:site-specific DNA recombinase